MKTIVLALVLGLPTTSLAATKMDFWKSQRRGANTFNNVPLKVRFLAAREFGIDFLRIAPNKWLNGRARKGLGDFLLGPKDEYRGLIQEDVRELKRVLDLAAEAKMKVVLTMLSLPGNRWAQHSGGKQQRDIWNDFKFHHQSAAMWRDLAAQLKGHPAVVGYNIKNEPCPERTGVRFRDWRTGNYEAWAKAIKDTPQDLNRFNRTIVEAIRKVDKETPIILEPGFYATPWAFKVLEPVSDPNTLYSFHMYEPYLLVGKKTQQRYAYPGTIPVGEGDHPVPMDWNRRSMEEFLAPVTDWTKANNIPSHRILVSEFGMFRKHKDVAAFLGDQIEVYNKKGWHWAYYSFREDDWHGMDYELGMEPPGAPYWKAIEARTMPGQETYGRKSPVADMLRKHLR